MYLLCFFHALVIRVDQESHSSSGMHSPRVPTAPSPDDIIQLCLLSYFT